MNKYHAKRTQVDNVTFASKAEARRYQELKALLHAGKIEGLTLQPKYDLVVAGTSVGKYYADFLYFDVERQCEIVEDVKGGKATATQVYRLKKRLVKALYNIDITEVA